MGLLKKSIDWVQEWKGFVLSVEKGTFWARLTDLTDPGTEEEEAEIPVGKLPAEEQSFVQLGAFFRWRIGSKGESEFRFSREAWEEKDLSHKPLWVRLDSLPRWKPKIVFWEGPRHTEDSSSFSIYCPQGYQLGE